MFLHTENSSQQAGNDVIQTEAVHCCLVVCIHMSRDARKPVFEVSDKV